MKSASALALISAVSAVATSASVGVPAMTIEWTVGPLPSSKVTVHVSPVAGVPLNCTVFADGTRTECELWVTPSSSCTVQTSPPFGAPMSTTVVETSTTAPASEVNPKTVVNTVPISLTMTTIAPSAVAVNSAAALALMSSTSAAATSATVSPPTITTVWTVGVPPSFSVSDHSSPVTGAPTSSTVVVPAVVSSITALAREATAIAVVNAVPARLTMTIVSSSATAVKSVKALVLMSSTSASATSARLSSPTIVTAWRVTFWLSPSSSRLRVHTSPAAGVPVSSTVVEMAVASMVADPAGVISKVVVQAAPEALMMTTSAPSARTSIAAEALMSAASFSAKEASVSPPPTVTEWSLVTKSSFRVSFQISPATGRPLSTTVVEVAVVGSTSPRGSMAYSMKPLSPRMMLLPSPPLMMSLLMPPKTRSSASLVVMSSSPPTAGSMVKTLIGSRTTPSVLSPGPPLPRIVTRTPAASR